MMAEAKLDEEFACELLRDHLAKCGVSGFQCTVNVADPPDLLVAWDNGVQWGVEVTRTYQQVKSYDGKKQVSSEQIGAALRSFAKELGEETKDIRKRSYTYAWMGLAHSVHGRAPLPRESGRIGKKKPEKESGNTSFLTSAPP